ncbi:MAG: prepilin-type N-terminal cleavage/methylation domain-containing protein [Gemmatimonadaceae bacterium]
MLSRRAFTVVELLVSLAVLGVILAAILGLIVSQQRFYAGAASMLETRTVLRDAADAVGGSLRGIAPGEGDIYSMTSSAVEFRAPAGASIACTIDATRTRVTIPALTLASGLALSTWPSLPADGDSLWIFDAGALPDGSDDRWGVAALTAAPGGGSCPVATGFSSSAAEAARGFTLALDGALPATIASGAAIRIFRRARYELYLAADGAWYLGYYDCLGSRATPCSAVQPVSGPYLAGSGSPPGLSLSFVDAAGATTADPRAVARVDVVARGESRTNVERGSRRRDSLGVRVRPRS